MAVNSIPKGYNAVTPYLLVGDVSAQIEFLQKAFDAELIEKVEMGNGGMHAEVRIRDSVLMIGGGSTMGSMPTMFYLYVEDVDAAHKKAVDAGGITTQEPKDQFYGDRSGAVKDSNGNIWWVASRKEELSQKQLEERAKAKV